MWLIRVDIKVYIRVIISIRATLRVTTVDDTNPA